jgi:hypothetical protein
MSVHRKRLKIGQTECGYDMSNTPWWLHFLSFGVMSAVLLFSYATLMENGMWPAIAGFCFGFGFLLLIYGHHFDRFYIHIGEKVKIGGDAYDPDRDEGFVGIEDGNSHSNNRREL